MSSVVERSALPLGLSKKSSKEIMRSLHALRLVEMTRKGERLVEMTRKGERLVEMTRRGERLVEMTRELILHSHTFYVISLGLAVLKAAVLGKLV